MIAPGATELPGGASGPVSRPPRKASTSTTDLSVSTVRSAAPAATTSDSSTCHSPIFTSPPVAPRCGITTGCFIPVSSTRRDRCCRTDASSARRRLRRVIYTLQNGGEQVPGSAPCPQLTAGAASPPEPAHALAAPAPPTRTSELPY